MGIDFTKRSTYYYDLPQEQIAQTPVEPRSNSRLLTVDRSEAAPLNEGEYYTFDIIGLTVFDMSGNELGTVENVLRTGSNDVYQARRTDGGELLIPALKAVVKEIDVPGGRMVVDMPEEISDAH